MHEEWCCQNTQVASAHSRTCTELHSLNIGLLPLQTVYMLRQGFLSQPSIFERNYWRTWAFEEGLQSVLHISLPTANSARQGGDPEKFRRLRVAFEALTWLVERSREQPLGDRCAATWQAFDTATMTISILSPLVLTFATHAERGGSSRPVSRIQPLSSWDFQLLHQQWRSRRPGAEWMQQALLVRASNRISGYYFR